MHAWSWEPGEVNPCYIFLSKKSTSLRKNKPPPHGFSGGEGLVGGSSWRDPPQTRFVSGWNPTQKLVHHTPTPVAPLTLSCTHIFYSSSRQSCLPAAGRETLPFTICLSIGIGHRRDRRRFNVMGVQNQLLHVTVPGE